jgi:hypothetical protein
MTNRNTTIKKSLTVIAALAALGSAAGVAHANGMIIPAYLPLTDLTDWNILKEGAATMQAGTNPNYKDYWVTVNSGSNGPFTSPSDWATAATLWDPIRANGGLIIGYVHTCQTPTGPLFRSLTDVENDINAWVAGYPNLDGIWIDEFYPRFEVADSTSVSANFPNGMADAPTDLSFMNPDGTFNANQINPSGGYYDQLTSWIRATYPNLKIVGNAGGWFYSNQVNYADIVDVDCSFEQNYATAANSPTNDWSGLNRQNVTTLSGQLALIHRNSSDMSGAIDQSIAHGYTHFYTTDRLLESNVWGGLPSYFASEVTYIANHS